MQHLHFVGVVDRAGVWVAVSDELAQLLGYTSEQLVGTSYADVMEPMEPKEQRRIDRQLEQTGSANGVATLIPRVGPPIRYAWIVRLVNGGELLVASGAPTTNNDAPAVDDDEWLTKVEACAYAHVSAATLDRAVKNGNLRVGGTRGLRLFRRSWLDAWLTAVIAVLLALLADVDLNFDADQLRDFIERLVG